MVRDRLGLSPSQTQATSAPNKGTVAFRMDEKPVVMCITAKEYKANGMPLLRTPTNSTGFQYRRNSAQWPFASMMGSKKTEAIATRMAAVGSAPSSMEATRMNKKEEPQMAARIKKSGSQPLA